MSDVNIRRATAADKPSLNRLLVQVLGVHHRARPDLFLAHGQKYHDDELTVILADDNTPVFVAELDGAVVGYAFCIHKRFQNHPTFTPIHTLYIDDLCVDETARGQHIGAQLYAYVLAYARECGCYNVTLNVWADNTAAVGFYEHLGLKPQKIGMETVL